uniref:Ig-like domain-containing protein n=1 Tax=Oryzias melastigma TaxID=30732 RepID=A0A3B3CAV2_ORYME
MFLSVSSGPESGSLVPFTNHVNWKSFFFLVSNERTALFLGLTEAAGILPDGPLNGSVGGSVMFTTFLTEADGPFTAVTWGFGVSTIMQHTTTGNLTNPAYEGRITFFPSTASLELKDLTLDDAGEYSVNVFPDGGGTTKLDVYAPMHTFLFSPTVPVSSVTVTPQSADLVEFSSFSLTCSSSGSSLSFIWMNSSSEVTSSDRVQITDGGSTLTVVDVTRYDEQSYRCRVFNPVSEGISDPVNILVSCEFFIFILSFSYDVHVEKRFILLKKKYFNYRINTSVLQLNYVPFYLLFYVHPDGPENTKMSASPSQKFYEEGSDISLSCSADSRPSAQFTWFVNGTKLPDSGPELTLRNIQFSQRGDYSCQAFNSKTLTNEMSPSLSISVLRKFKQFFLL